MRDPPYFTLVVIPRLRLEFNHAIPPHTHLQQRGQRRAHAQNLAPALQRAPVHHQLRGRQGAQVLFPCRLRLRPLRRLSLLRWAVPGIGGVGPRRFLVLHFANGAPVAQRDDEADRERVVRPVAGEEADVVDGEGEGLPLDFGAKGRHLRGAFELAQGEVRGESPAEAAGQVVAVRDGPLAGGLQREQRRVRRRPRLVFVLRLLCLLRRLRGQPRGAGFGAVLEVANAR